MLTYTGYALYSLLLWGIASFPLFLYKPNRFFLMIIGLGILFTVYWGVSISLIHWSPEQSALTADPFILVLFTLVLSASNAWALIYAAVRYRGSNEEEKTFLKRILPALCLFLPGWFGELYFSGIVASLLSPLLYLCFSVYLLMFAWQNLRKSSINTADTDSALWALNNGLTERETEILKHLLRGTPNHEIGEILYISVNTVKTHIRSILAKTKAGNRFELLLKISKFNQNRSAPNISRE